MEIKKINSNDWLNLVNAESHPSLDSYQTMYLELDNKFAVCLVTGYGVFRSGFVDKEEDLKEEELKLVKEYEEAKSFGSVFVPKFNSITTF